MKGERKQPRSPTLALPVDLRPQLVVEGARFAIRNLSVGGVGVWTPEATAGRFVVGATHEGALELGGAAYPVRVEVRYHEGRVLGLRLVAPSRDLSAKLEKILEPARLGGALRLHGSPGEEDPSNGYARLWYAGPDGAELIVWYNPSSRMIAALAITWRTYVVIRHQQKGIETGERYDVPLRAEGKLPRDEAYERKHPTSDPVLVRQAAQFLAAVNPPLPASLLWQFLETGEQVYLPASSDKQSDVA